MTDGVFWSSGFEAQVVSGDWNQNGDDTLGVFKPLPTSFVLVNDNNNLEGDEFYLFGDIRWLAVAGNIGEHPPLPDVTLLTVASGLDRPLFATAPAGDDRLFVVEQRGRIKVVENGVVHAALFPTGVHE